MAALSISSGERTRSPVAVDGQGRRPAPTMVPVPPVGDFRTTPWSASSYRIGRWYVAAAVRRVPYPQRSGLAHGYLDADELAEAAGRPTCGPETA